MAKRGRITGGRGRVAFKLALAYVVVSLVYTSLPWHLREPVYRAAPKVDRALQKSGQQLIEVWDELALIGKDSVAEVRGTHSERLHFAGYPSQGLQLFGRVDLLENEGYVVGYCDTRKNPLWACYRVFDVSSLSSGPRPSFYTDERTKAKVSKDDYTNSGFDRGHLAPNYAIATRYGTKAQRETFLMSNIIPQTPKVNQHLWKDLEMRVAKRYGRYFSEVWVITGPVFREPVERLESGVQIPSDYYKIILDQNKGKVRVLAFLVPRDCPPYTRIKTCLVSVDEIEALTGLNFFPALSEEEQALLESKAAGRLWPWLFPAYRYHFKGVTQ